MTPRRDKLFVYTLNDLEERLQPRQDEYKIFMAAPLLRKLLLEEQGPAELANRTRRLKIRYPVNDRLPPTDPMPMFWWPEDTFFPHPDLPPELFRPIEVTKDQLLVVRPS